MSVMGEVAKKYRDKNTKIEGLTEKEANKRLEKYGLNIINQKKKTSAIKIIIEQFSDFMTLILLGSTAISIFMGEITEAVTIISIVILNAILGFIQEYKTEKTLEALKSLSAPTAKVIRNNVLVNIAAEKVVPGDVILVEAGDRIPADAVLFEAISLNIDESLLTGESIPVEKTENNTKSEQMTENSAFMGTIVTGGRGKGVVSATGMNTEMGRIADLIQSIEDEDTPLQRKLEHLGKFIIAGCLVICAIVSVTGILRGEPLFSMLLSGISLAVAAVPEGLPAIVTIALAIGVQRMVKRKALVRKLPAVETLGCASIICSDKTGTLTENKMTVRKIFTGGNLIEVTGNGYDFNGDFLIKRRKVTPDTNSDLKLTLEIGALCNNASITENKRNIEKTFSKIKSIIAREDRWVKNGDPTELALLIAGEKGKISKQRIEENYIRIKEEPFDSDRKCMSVVCKDDRGRIASYVKGAPDIILKKCTKIQSSGSVMDLNPLLRKNILKANETMGEEALRVLGVAYKPVNKPNLSKMEMENDLIFVGLIGMIDPPRKEAFGAVQKSKLAGIKPVMITGDHRTTAKAIAQELSIYNPGDKILTGEELERMSDSELKNIVGNVSVFARVSAKHKLRIVRSLKEKGHVVAMTGDGVNDAPAIKEADIGISMGISGTDVTKQASSMILMDDNFATIVAAVEEGRVIYNNIRKFIRYLLSCNIGEVLTMFVGMLIGLPLPLLPIQILLVNLVTDGLPAIALGLEPAEKDIMSRKPRSTKEHIFSDGLLNLILLRGVFISVCTLAVFTTFLHFNNNVEIARTGALVTLVMTQLIHVFECKSEKYSIFSIPLFNNISLVLAMLCSLVMIISVVYVPQLQMIFNTVAISMNEWIIIVGYSALGPIISSFFLKNKR